MEEETGTGCALWHHVAGGHGGIPGTALLLVPAVPSFAGFLVLVCTQSLGTLGLLMQSLLMSDLLSLGMLESQREEGRAQCI